VTRQYPELPELARPIQENQARQELARLYFHSVGAAQQADLVRLFGWTPAQASRVVTALAEAGEICMNMSIANQPGEWIALPELVE
jgi:uncharacterized protein YcaQ